MQPIWIIFLFLLGACIGSFLNVVIYRLPRGQSIAFPGSHCPSCGRAIRWYDNIPLVSWLALRGRCRFCKVRISPRYLLIELAVALLFVGLYVAYYGLRLRDGVGSFGESWMLYAVHLALLTGLLACSVIDIECWIVPLEVCWCVSIFGLLAAAAAPNPHWLAPVSPNLGAACLGAAAGLATAIFMLRRGWILPSFIDAVDLPDAPEDEGVGEESAASDTPTRVAFSKAHGVNPREEILREVVFLLPIAVGAAGAYLLVTKISPVAAAWREVWDWGGGRVGAHLGGLFAAVFGYFIAGLWIWGVRILGTLAFGKEAMGLGDAHLLAAVGAVAGWRTATTAFFLAPVLGLLWAIRLWARKGQRELPYGPWLSLAAAVALLFHDQLLALLEMYRNATRAMF